MNALKEIVICPGYGVVEPFIQKSERSQVELGEVQSVGVLYCTIENRLICYCRVPGTLVVRWVRTLNLLVVLLHPVDGQSCVRHTTHDIWLKNEIVSRLIPVNSVLRLDSCLRHRNLLIMSTLFNKFLWVSVDVVSFPQSSTDWIWLSYRDHSLVSHDLASQTNRLSIHTINYENFSHLC